MTASTPPTAPVRGHHRLACDRGSTSVEMVGYTAVMLAALLIGVQVAVWGLAQLACSYAANHALQTTRVQGGTASAGRSDATTVLTSINGNLVTDAKVSTNRTATTATVTVTGTAVTVIPFLSLPVSTTVNAPVESLDPNPG
jgi:peptidoglycan/LPS O-acetylase OafA/YrhL